MGSVVDCVGCGRKVKLNKYKCDDYRCAKCRGIEIPKQVKVQIREEKGLHIK